jgi:dihydropteroate synthase
VVKIVEFSEFNKWLAEPAAARRPLVFGVLNATPDSFSDGGQFSDAESAADFAARLINDGADCIDCGGESTRPGAGPVSADEQIRRVIPVIRMIRQRSDVVISIDTTSAAVAAAALDAGAEVINDISAGRFDAEMLALTSRRGVPIILMHMQGTPATMQNAPVYQNVTAEVAQFLIERRDAAVAAGIRRENILLDPGIGFGKTVSHDLQLLRDTRELAGLGHPLVVGVSRKKFIGRILEEPDPKQRVFGTAAAVAYTVANGAAAVRVHDVGPITQVVRMTRAISRGKTPEFLKE